MKRLIIFLTIIFGSFAVFAQQQDVVTETYKVDGCCSECKKRIEDAAHVKGVKRADWNKETHVLTVIYKPSKTNADEILKAVALAGHSSEKITATEKAYNKLPECCRYKTSSCEH